MSYKNFILNIVGDGPDLNELKKTVDNLGLSNYIIFYGPVTNDDELKHYYLQSDLFVFPSHDEGFPRVLYEAAIFGLPIATTFVGTIDYLMKDNYNCIKLPVNNAPMIGESIIEILINYNNILDIAKNATKTVTKYLKHYKYSHAGYINKLINT